MKMAQTEIVSNQPHQRVRIAHIMFSLQPGGLENGVVNLSNRLDREEFDVSIVCLEEFGEFSRRLCKDVTLMNLEKPRGVSIRTAIQLARWIRGNDPDVIHTHNLGPLLYAVASCALAFRGFPILHGEHGTFRDEDLTWNRIFLRKFLYRFCRKVHTVSESLRNYLVEFGFPSSKIVAYLNGVDCEVFAPPEKREALMEKHGIPDSALVIGMVGRLIASKRHEMMLDAFVEIRRRHRSAFLLIVGDRGDRREDVIQKIRSHPYSDSILWVGHQDDPIPFYQIMSLLAMPSSIEGLSNALLEAMACGVPCAAHPACGASEVIVDGVSGILAEMDSSDQIANALGNALADPSKLDNLGSEARKVALADFSIDGMVKRYTEGYQEVARVGN